MHKIAILFIVIWSLLGSIVQCQTPSFPFINFDQNYIKFGQDSANFQRFLSKMEDLKEGRRQRVTIVHIGGSHVQAGFWTEALQDSLQVYAGTSGGGKFLFPYQAIGTNGPASYNSFSKTNWAVCKSTARDKCPELGLSGITLTTQDSIGQFGFAFRPSSGLRQFDSAKIFHNKSSSYLLSLPSISEEEYSQQYSIREGFTRFFFAPQKDSLVISFSKMDTSSQHFTLYGVTVEDSRPGIFSATLGVNGASTSTFEECTALPEQIGSLRPDLVIFSLGVNDVQNIHFDAEKYILQYDSLVANISRVSPDCSFLFTTVSDHYRKRKYPNRRTMLANEALAGYCAKKGFAIWDLFRVMGGFRSIALWQQSGLAARDKIHFSAAGYRLLAKLMFQAIFPVEKRKH